MLKPFNEKRIAFSTNAAETTGYPHAKEILSTWIWSSSSHYVQKLTQNGWDLNIRAKIVQLFYFIYFIFKIFIYLFILAVPDLSCGTRDLLVVACQLLVAVCMWDLLPRPGIEPGPTALGVRSRTHLTTREVPKTVQLLKGNLSVNLHDPRLSKYFLNMTPKAQQQAKKINWTLLKCVHQRTLTRKWKGNTRMAEHLKIICLIRV